MFLMLIFRVYYDIKSVDNHANSVIEVITFMKLLKISVTGLPLFKEKCEIDFLAMQRVSSDNAEKMSCIFSTNTQCFYQNNVISFIGINASGKTSILKLITFVSRMLNNDAINNIANTEILDGVEENQFVTFDVYFYSENGSVNLIHTVVSKQNGRFLITDEYLKSKSAATIKRKADIFAFDRCSIAMARNKDEAFLLDDVSIMVAFNKKNHDRLIVTDMLRHTNVNQLSIPDDYPAELIAFFDPSIEYLHISHKTSYRQSENTRTAYIDFDIQLKFYGKEAIILHRLSELNRYLSSGTIKGINTFARAIKTFQRGGYLIIDEIENHFNREIVSTLMRFYMDPKVNPKGAMLIFSTHYAELLDEFERNDNIYIVRNRNGITSENLSTILKRNDIKKSEAYQSGYLDGTVPAYDAYMALKKTLLASSKEAK